MRKIALVDLDDTLFDTREFKREYFDFLKWFPYDNLKIVEETYEKSKEKGFYDPSTHCMELAKHTRMFSGRIRLCIQEWFLDSGDLLRRMVFADTELFLRLLGSYGYEVYILTLGTEWFQKAKIEGAGLLQYISGVTVTRDPKKTSAIADICNPETDDVLLFDDFWEVIDAVKRVFPRIAAVQVLREHVYDITKQAARADAVAGNLEEAMGALLGRPR